MKLATVRKTVAALVGVVSQLVALGVLHGMVLEVATAVIAVGTAAGVYVVPNAV